MIRCPICRRQFDPDQSPALPFCSDRCRLIDLKRWVDEEYGLPQEGSDPEEIAESE